MDSCSLPSALREGSTHFLVAVAAEQREAGASPCSAAEIDLVTAVVVEVVGVPFAGNCTGREWCACQLFRSAGASEGNFVAEVEAGIAVAAVIDSHTTVEVGCFGGMDLIVVAVDSDGCGKPRPSDTAEVTGLLGFDTYFALVAAAAADA